MEEIYLFFSVLNVMPISLYNNNNNKNNNNNNGDDNNTGKGTSKNWKRNFKCHVPNVCK